MRRTLLLPVLLLLSLCASVLPAVPARAAEALVPLGSQWRYLDDGSNQGTAWVSPGFDDSSWARGAAELGYGDGDEATVVSFGPDESKKYITTYFRHRFSVDDGDAWSELVLRLRRDDGAVVYLNGEEIARSNMPDGTITSTTTAASASDKDDESALHEYSVPDGLLESGGNVLAVSVHQRNRKNPDLSFDLELSGSPDAGPEPVNEVPVVAVVVPSEGAVVAGLVEVVVEAGDAEDPVEALTVEVAVDGGGFEPATLEESSGQFVWSWDTAAVADGAHQLQARVTDLQGAVATSGVVAVEVVNADPEPVNEVPVVAVVVPSEGAVVAGLVEVVVEAGDAEDPVEALTVEVAVDGGGFEPATLEESSGQFVWSWDTAAVADGAHQLQARVTDSQGAVATSGVVAVEVENADPESPNELPEGTLVPLEAQWRYLDDGSDQGTAWTGLGFDDGGWRQGPAELGYGDGDESTVVSFGPDESRKYITTYFRHRFEVADPSALTDVTLRLRRDDGAVAYLNGVKVARSNMPDGTITFTTTAASAVAGDDESALHPFAVPEGVLVAGHNVLAVSVHQRNRINPDLSFDAQLTAVVDADPEPVNELPVVAVVVPSEGAVVAGLVEVVVEAGDAEDPVEALTVEVAVDGGGFEPATLEESSGQFVWGWDTAAVADGAHQLQARVTDLQGAVATSGVVTVEVENASPVDGPFLVGAGDIASCSRTGDEATAALLETLLSGGGNGVVVAVGDTTENGTAEEYENCYGPTWGRHKDRTRPAVGNHEYFTTGASGYFDYFGSRAGSHHRGYYSYDHGGWHIVVLNSMCQRVGGCGAGSPQEQWLRADLASNPTTCTAAYWHHARFSSGIVGSDTDTFALWQALHDHGAELVLSGHEHLYERFAPQTAAGLLDSRHGIRQFTVGTGGHRPTTASTPITNSEVLRGGIHGVLQIELDASSYNWRFVPAEGFDFVDTGSADCHSRPIQGRTALVRLGAQWRYLDDGSEQGAVWTGLGFDDGGWKQGPAELGYGDGDEATVVSFGPNESRKHITTYFRHDFEVADPGALTDVTLQLLRDDGAVAYLNGVEIARSNMPEGTITSTTTATSAVAGVEENQLHTFSLPEGVLVEGENVLAVSIHQRNRVNDDISFDAVLTAREIP